MKVEISKKASLQRPYIRVQETMRARVKEGIWLPGSMIPSRRDLALEFGVSVTVVERAVASLVAAGVLHPMDRRGTFVSIETNALASDASFQDRHTVESAIAGGKAIQGISSVLVESHQFKKFSNIGIIAHLSASEDKTRIEDHWAGIILSSLERAISHAGGISTFYNLHSEYGADSTSAGGIKALLKADVDAIVVVRGIKSATLEMLALTEEVNVPIVFVISPETPPSVRAVYYDSYDAGFQAARHLIQRDHESIVFFSPYTTDWVRERLAGSRTALKFAGIPQMNLTSCVVDLEIEQTNGDHELMAYESARLLLLNGLPGRAVIAANDSVAYGFMKAAREVGLEAGVDYALVGFDDQPQSRLLGLTTFQPPLEAAGIEAVRMVIRVLNGESSSMQTRIATNLVARTSSQPFTKQNLATSPLFEGQP